MTRQEAAALLAVLQAAYPRFYADKKREEIVAAVNLWTELFSDYPAKIVTASVKAYITDDNKYPPAPGQIMEKVRKITQPEEMTEQEAWALVAKALKNSGYNSAGEFARLPPEIQSVLHDPAQLKAWAIDEHFNEAVVSSNFMRSYRARAASIREFKALPADVRKLALQAGAGLALDKYLRLEDRHET